MLYFTSDLHLGHETALRFRPGLETIEEMNDTLIANINESVAARDEL